MRRRYSNAAGTGTAVGTTTFTWDGGEETGITATDATGSVVSSYSYTYNAAGLVTGMVQPAANGEVQVEFRLWDVFAQQQIARPPAPGADHPRHGLISVEEEKTAGRPAQVRGRARVTFPSAVKRPVMGFTMSEGTRPHIPMQLYRLRCRDPHLGACVLGSES